ncbi:MAG: hypothetical protein WD010_09625, partial [Nitriliruptor sp.]
MPRLVAAFGLLALLAAGCAGGASAADCDRLPGVRPNLCITPVEDREPAPTRVAPILGDATAETSVTS